MLRFSVLLLIWVFFLPPPHILSRGQDVIKMKSGQNVIWRYFCGKILTTFLTFPLKIPNLHTHYPWIIALLQSRPPSASSGHSWGGRGYLFQNLPLFNLTFRTCNLEVFCPFQKLSSEKPEIFTFKLQVPKVRLRRTSFWKGYPRLLQE